jgi:choline dehydrogenase-like flavoprotein
MTAGDVKVSKDLAARPSLLRQETHLRWALIVGAVLFVAEAAVYVPQVFSGPPATRPFAINSVAKDVLFAAVTALAAADLTRRVRLISLVVLGHVVIVLLLLLSILTGDSVFTFPPPRWLADLIPGLDISAGVRATVWLIGASVATLALLWLRHRALKARYDLRYLWPFEHATLAAVAEASLSEPAVAPAEVATAVDHYWASLDIGYKRRLRLSLWGVCFLPLVLPLIFRHPPFPWMERSARHRFLERYFVTDVASRKELGFLRSTVQSAFRFPIQLSYMGYYNDPRSYASTGYVPFSQRPNYPGSGRKDPQLRMHRPPEHGERLRTEVLIIGTGAGGSIVAHVLAERGRKVLMLDRGRYVRPSTYVEDEALQYARLYSDGALQISRDFSFQILQGMCVGGSTVVNNGVCFDLPAEKLAEWNSSQFDAGLEPNLLQQSFAEARRLIGAQVQAHTRPNPVVDVMPNAGLQPVEANLSKCLGCGYCNIGCAFDRKLSMLTNLLPKTQRETDEHRTRNPGFEGELQILPRCEVISIRQRHGRATGATCQLRHDDGTTRKIEVEADLVVLAAGAVHSSRLLMASGLGGPLVGRGLSANLGSHMTGYWSEGPPVRAFDGLQMSHFLDDPSSPYKIETWFNPVMSQAVVMPGWLQDHENNMRRYDRLACLGVITGSTRSDANQVLRRRTFTGSEIAFTASDVDLKTLLAGLRQAGKLLLDASADCVMPATFKYWELDRRTLDRLRVGDLVMDGSDISVNTGHPQGGNPISRDPNRGVIDETFRVHGVENLHVCDASVFPTAITVNPQLTVMALAHYAAVAHIGR